MHTLLGPEEGQAEMRLRNINRWCNGYSYSVGQGRKEEERGKKRKKEEEEEAKRRKVVD